MFWTKKKTKSRVISSTDKVFYTKSRDHWFEWYLEEDHIKYSGLRSEKMYESQSKTS